MLRVGELTERGMLAASIRPRNALRLKGLIPLLFGLARDCRRVRVLYLQPAVGAAGAALVVNDCAVRDDVGLNATSRRLFVGTGARGDGRGVRGSPVPGSHRMEHDR